ncbi:MAG: transketolase C-terminal domain-containing protein [Patescibacteria group bacterium]|nr:transketolase C-terminal domain-containing protein [Patescibacteria group bacterium]
MLPGMINKENFLSENIFEKNISTEPLRDGFGRGLLKLGMKNPEVVVISADLKESTRCHWFAEKYPERFIETGVAEQNMAAIAAGLGISAKIPFISSYAVFSPGRNWEQIRTTIAYNNSNVKIAGHHAGVSAGPDGATHQAIEDIAIMRAMPNIKIIAPCDSIEAEKATIASISVWGPMYLRFAREKTSVLTAEKTNFTPGKAYIMFDTSSGSARKEKKPQVLIIGAGPILYNALLAAKELEDEKIGTIVLNSHTIKPIDDKKIIELTKKCGAVVTVEEHNILGGLGGAVSEVLAKNYPAPMEFIGIKDVFTESGNYEQLPEKYGLGVKSIISAVKKVIKRK